MTKLTLINDFGEYSVSSVDDALDLTEMCELFNSLLLAATYKFDGEVTIDSFPEKELEGGN